MKKASLGSWFGSRSWRKPLDTIIAVAGAGRRGADNPDRPRARLLWRRNLARAFAFHPDVVSGDALLAVLDAEEALEREARESRGRAPSLREEKIRGAGELHDGAWRPERRGSVRSV